MVNSNKLQSLIISELYRRGSLQILLPDGVVLELGINQENNVGELVKTDNYCWVIASRKDRQVSLDKYNMGLRFLDENDTIVFDEKLVDKDGYQVRRLDVV